MRKFCLILLLFLCIYPSRISAAGLTLTPAYQEITASDSATITYTNTNPQPIDLSFFLQRIIATDLLGRLQFNAPLPQTLQNIDSNLAEINPNQLSLGPGQTASVTATFNPTQLNPGTTAFLLLAQINSSSLGTKDQGLGTNLNQYLGSTILVNALGGHQTKLELIKTSLSRLPFLFSHPDFLQLTLKNSGNTRSIPHGPIIITDQFGRIVMRGAVNADSTAILPGSQRIIYARLQPAHFSFPVSLNRFQLTFSDDVSAAPISLQKYYLYLNPYFISGLALIIGLIIFLKKRNISRYNPK